MSLEGQFSGKSTIPAEARTEISGTNFFLNKIQETFTPAEFHVIDANILNFISDHGIIKKVTDEEKIEKIIAKMRQYSDMENGTKAEIEERIQASKIIVEMIKTAAGESIQ